MVIKGSLHNSLRRESMPDLSLSFKEVGEVISSTSRAFDDLYSTLRRIAIDGWKGGDNILAAIRTRKDERRAKSFILYLRQLQVRKIELSVLLDYNSDVEKISDQLWIKIEEGLGKILHEVKDLQEEISGDTTGILFSSALRPEFSKFVEGMFIRSQVVATFIESRSTMSETDSKIQISRLVGLLELEAKLIGRCADLLSEYVDAQRSQRLGTATQSS
jgi:hypothetical protein